MKIDGRYYKSREVYDQSRREIELRKKIVCAIHQDFLGYEPGQTFLTLVPRKLKELSFYPGEVILKALESIKRDALYHLGQDGKFSGDYGKVCYLFAMLNNTVNDVYRIWKQEEKLRSQQRERDASFVSDVDSLDTVGANAARPVRDISGVLEDDEI